MCNYVFSGVNTGKPGGGGRFLLAPGTAASSSFLTSAYLSGPRSEAPAGPQGWDRCCWEGGLGAQGGPGPRPRLGAQPGCLTPWSLCPVTQPRGRPPSPAAARRKLQEAGEPQVRSRSAAPAHRGGGGWGAQLGNLAHLREGGHRGAADGGCHSRGDTGEGAVAGSGSSRYSTSEGPSRSPLRCDPEAQLLPGHGRV